MGAAHKSPYAVLQLDQGASLSAIEAAYARGLRLLEEGSMASYGMFDAASTQRLRDELDAAYRALKRAAPQQPPKPPKPPKVPAAAAPAAEEQQPEPAAATRAHVGPPPSATAAAAPEVVQVAKKRAAAAPKPAQDPAASAAEAPPPPPTLAAPTRVRLCAPRTEPLSEPLTGAVLRQLREQLGADIDDVCDLTKINRRYIVALEEEDFSLLPATVYVRGFVSEYARVLGLAPQATAPYIEAYAKWSRARL